MRRATIVPTRKNLWATASRRKRQGACGELSPCLICRAPCPNNHRDVFSGRKRLEATLVCSSTCREIWLQRRAAAAGAA